MDLTGAAWRKASRSNDSGANCVELAPLSAAIAIRDSKDVDGDVLLLTPRDFRHLTDTIKNL
ncbi:DUF397 domain-containing protein [Actinomadura fibrosa]|uniref:DUF397 domain-containing protein n=1 Tax=Actinomadura fibrosa TaxID=111802 RepID=A0ABW2XZM2_9ACTN|nr:DUF397 domain-containing protein [Actinomadura fibrosa]